jgi:tRNA(Leu) C34 or U34 (ribose-2'-O)-methylase TrmL
MTTVFLDPKPAITSPIEFQFMVYNVNKVNNIGNMLRSAVAMGCKTCVIVGNRKIQGFGSKGTDQFITYNHFDTINDAKKSLTERGFEIIGIEIGNNAQSVLNPTQAFTKPTCFLFGEEGHGLSPHAKAVCDRYVYIPQYGNGTASLNVSNAAAIIFFHFAQWAKYVETKVEGEKFAIDYTQSVTKIQKDENGEIVLNATQQAIRDQRAAKKQKIAQDIENDFDGQEEVQLGTEEVELVVEDVKKE